MKSFKTYCEQTWNGGYVNFFAPLKDPVQNKGSRHRANIIRDPRGRKHLQTVPEYIKPDPDIIQKVESIKNKFSHYQPINMAQLKEICKKYKIYKVTKDTPKKLGNTGISIIWDENLKTFAIKK